MMQSAVEPEKAADLGTMLEEFPAGNRAGVRWATGILGSVLLLGGIFLLGYGLYSGYIAYYRHGPAVVWQNLLLPASLGLLLLFLGGLYSRQRACPEGQINRQYMSRGSCSGIERWMKPGVGMTWRASGRQ